MKGKLLICAYYFPPIGTPGSFRWKEFVKHLSSRGWKTDVLTIYTFRNHPNYDPKLLEDMSDEVRIFRTYPGVMHHLSSLLLSKGNTIASPEHSEGIAKQADNQQSTSPHTPDSFRQTVGKFLFKIFEKGLRAIFIPDEAVSWLPFALIKGRQLIKENSYDVIISSGFPFTCHILGFLLKWLSGGRPWIADYGDPWVYNPSFPLPRWRSFIDKKIESRVLKTVNKVIITTDKTKEHYLDLYPFLKSEDIKLITQGFSHVGFHEAPPETTDKFSIVYTGMFYKANEPFMFFDALKYVKEIWKDLEVIIAGNMPNDKYRRYAENNGLSEIVHFIGFVPQKRAFSLQKGASLLLLIGPSGGIQVPGKTYEYVAARRPILSIKVDDYDIASTVVERLKRGITVQNDSQKITESIIHLYNLWKNKRLESGFNLEYVDEFCWDRLTDKLEETILEATQT